MEGGEDKVAGGSGRCCQLDRFEIAHFAYEKDIRILAEGAAQSRGKGLGVDAYFAVLDKTALTPMHELNRVLDCDDMVLPMNVGIVNHCRQGCGLPGASRTGDE